MSHTPVAMEAKPVLELEILDDIVEITCPICKYSIVDFERNFVFRPYNYICKGVERQQVKKQELDIPF